MHGPSSQSTAYARSVEIGLRKWLVEPVHQFRRPPVDDGFRVASSTTGPTAPTPASAAATSRVRRSGSSTIVSLLSSRTWLAPRSAAHRIAALYPPATA